jgi:hypothetical protein
MEFMVGFWIIFAFLGAWIASQKGRSGGEGFALGCLFGPIGALIVALLPGLPPPVPQASVLPPRPEPIVLTPQDIEAARQRAADELVRRELEQEAARKRCEAGRIEAERKQAEFQRQVLEHSPLAGEGRIRFYRL